MRPTSAALPPRHRPLRSTLGLWLLAAALAFAAMPGAVQAANPFQEVKGAQDHPLISRFKGSILFAQGGVSFEQVAYPVSATEKATVEGKVSNYRYVGPADRSDLEVFRSFRQALEGAGFKVVFACEDAPACQKQGLDEHASTWTDKPSTFVGGYSSLARMDRNGNYPPRFLVARLQRPQGAEVTAILTVKGPSSTEKGSGVGAPYFLQVVESAAMESGNVAVKTLAADALDKGLAADGKVALYGIYFDTGMAVLKPESKPQLDEMAKLMSLDPALKVFIVGHTDNQGGLEGNLALSQKRADAVVAALAAQYKVDARRMLARGVAGFAPVASNGSEAGRAKNRRVELVRQ